MTTIATNRYASVGKRFVAIIIDGFLLQILYFIAYGKPPAPEDLSTPKGIAYNLLAAIIGWIYFALMESSSLQATFGKRLLGIVVTNTDGDKISFGRATLRYLAKSFWILIFIFAFLVALMTRTINGGQSPYLAFVGLLFLIAIAVLFIGYLMAFFTPEKQALHDIIARCLVVNGNGQAITIPWKTVIGLAITTIVAGRLISQIPETNSSDTTVVNNPPATRNQSTENTDNNQSSNIPNTNNSENQENPPSRNNNVFGLELVQPNDNLFGVWQLEFANGAVQHQALLSMRGTSGVMLVRLADGQGGTQTIRQNMKLWSSAKGLVLIGKNPINPKTNNLVATYSPDNFLIAVQPDNSLGFRNYSINTVNNSVFESPVERKFIGYPSIGVKMVELTPKNQKELNQQSKLPFQLNRDKGVVILEVERNSNANKAGVQPGDVILSINDTQINEVKQVQQIIRSTGLDAVLKLEIDRDGNNLSLQVQPGCCVPPETAK